MTIRKLMTAAGCLGLLAVLAAPRPAGAYGYLESRYGTPMIGLSARAIGMGGATTAIADGSFSLVSNPALLSYEQGQVADLTFRGIRYDETRFVPLWDSFDAFVKDTGIAENPNTYAGLNGGIVWRPKGAPSGLALAGGFFERYNLTYDFVDERRSAVTSTSDLNVDKVRATQTLSSSRAIYSATAGVSYREKVLSIGAALDYYFGDITTSDINVPGPAKTTDASDRALRDVFTRDMTGVGGTFGVAADISEHLRVAAAYNFPVRFDVDWRRQSFREGAGGSFTDSLWVGSNQTHYPGRLAVGLAYRPQNSLRTTFTLDVARTYWSDLTDETGGVYRPVDAKDGLLKGDPMLTVTGLRDASEYRFGLEHIFYNDLPARFGFFYRQTYASAQSATGAGDRQVDEAGMSFGTGYRFEKFDVGISGDVMKRTYRQSPITPRLTTAQSVSTDRVQDSFLRGVIDVRYHF